MKIAVPINSDNYIDGHFGHCESYGIYTISEEKMITDIKTMASPQGCGCKSDIASVLSADGVTVMLAGGIGGGAINVLNSSGIEVIRGCSGKADDIVRLYIDGMVQDSGSSCHQHGSHDHDSHTCGHNHN
jgi:predicted Fe-Mo cluster-binding NifX family protein